jgi:hypothetical protein
MGRNEDGGGGVNMLQEIYENCTKIIIEPHNANVPKGSVRISAHCVVKNASGNYEYSDFNVDRPTLDAALGCLHYFVIGFKKLVEEMK